MRRWISATLAILIMCVLPADAANKSKSKKAQSFPDLCLEILECLESNSPVSATQMGIHAYDNRLADYSPAGVRQFVRQLKQYESRLTVALKQIKTAEDS